MVPPQRSPGDDSGGTRDGPGSVRPAGDTTAPPAVEAAGAAGRAPRRRTAFKILTVLLMLGVAEGASWAVLRAGLTGRRYSKILALCNGPDQFVSRRPNTFWHHELNPLYPRYRDELNPKGTRGPDFEIPKPDGEFRIVCVGDSTTEGVGVEPHETVSHYLEEMLEAEIEAGAAYASVRVVNAGVGSHNSAFNLVYLALRLIHFDPDAVVIKSSYNDYLPYVVPGMELDYTHAFPHPYALEESHNPYWAAARYSHLLKLLGIVLFRHQIDSYGKNLRGGAHTRKHTAVMDYSSNRDKFGIYAENIRSMILLCKGRRIKTFVLDLPTAPDLALYRNKEWAAPFRDLIARLELELERVAGEEGVPYVRTGPLGASAFWDHCHGTPSGNREIATRLADAITPALR